MKNKILVVVLILTMIFAFTSCGGNTKTDSEVTSGEEGYFEGMVIDYTFDDNGRVYKAKLKDISENGDGDTYDIYFNEYTSFTTESEELKELVNPEDFYTGKYRNMGIVGGYYIDDGKYCAKIVYLPMVFTGESIMLSDGTNINTAYDGKGKDYRTEDGTSLLYTNITYSNYDDNMKPFDEEVSEEVMNNIREYFDNLGEQFDVASILESCNEKYKNNDDYFVYLNQSTKPEKHDEGNVYYITYVSLGDGASQNVENHFTFDIATGNLVSSDYQ